MGGNATGKTSLGRLLMRFVNCFKDGSYARFTKIIDDKKKDALYRFSMHIAANESGEYREKGVDIHIYYTDINKKDNYEICANRLDENDCIEITYEQLNTIREVTWMKELDNAYAIKFKNRSAIIKEGKLLDAECLSSGTKAGVDISYIVASLIYISKKRN